MVGTSNLGSWNGPWCFFSHIWRNGIWQLWLTRLATTTTTEPWDPPRAALRRRPQRRGKNYNVWGWFESNQGLVICRWFLERAFLCICLWDIYISQKYQQNWAYLWQPNGAVAGKSPNFPWSFRWLGTSSKLVNQWWIFQPKCLGESSISLSFDGHEGGDKFHML